MIVTYLKQLNNKNSASRFDLAFGVIILLYAVVFVLFHAPHEWYDGDSSEYIGTAQSIIKDHSYTFNFGPQTKFPPGYPLFLALLSAVSNNGVNNNGFFVSGTALLGLLGIVAAYLVIKKKSPAGAFCISLLFLTSPFFFSHAIKTVASDLPYLAFSLLAIISGRQLESQKKGIQRIAWGILFTLFLVLTLMTRSIGITLLFAYCIYTVLPLVAADSSPVFKHLRIYALPLLIGLLCETAWLYWSSNHRVLYYPGQYMDSYFTQIRLLNPHLPESGWASITDIGLRIFNNIITQLTHLSEMLIHLEWLARSWFSPFVIIPALLLIISFLHQVYTRRIELPTIYLLLYMGMLLIWPFDEGQRFIMPVFPLLSFFIFDGSKIILYYSKNAKRKLVTSIMVLSVSVVALSVPGILFLKHRGMQHYMYMFFWVGTASFMLLLKLKNIHFISAIKKFYLNNLCHHTKLTHRIRNYCSALFLLFILFYGLLQEYKTGYILHKNNPVETNLNNYVLAANWLKIHAPPAAVIAATQPSIPHQISGLQVVPLPVTLSGDVLLNCIRDHNVSYIIIINEGQYPYFRPTDEDRLKCMRKEAGISFCLVDAGERYWIYQVKS